MKKILEKTLDRLRENSEEPWGSFEVVGFEDDGRIKVNTNWNKAFIEKIRSLGFHAETEEDSVQLFFYAAQARPTSIGGFQEGAESAEHPNLNSDKNQYRT